MNKERAKFIVIEGNDGAGKTTQVARLTAYLLAQGLDVLATKEPGGIEETKILRVLIMDPRLKDDGVAQLLLFTTDRRLHLILEVLPALEEGRIVVSDRFSGSTIVYQHYDRGIALDTVVSIDTLARSGPKGTKEIKPDLVILLDVSPEVGIRRKQGGELNYFDKDGEKVQATRREGYLKLARDYGWVVVDANKPEDEVFEDILTVFNKKGILPKEKK